jgi:hypothetical protein
LPNVPMIQSGTRSIFYSTAFCLFFPNPRIIIVVKQNKYGNHEGGSGS